MSTEPKEPRRLNATAGSLLGFLHDGPQSGWDLVASARERIGDFWSLTQSQIYRELSTMATHGLIETDEMGPRDRRAYRLTPAGRAAFLDWLRRSPGPEHIRYPLLLTLSFAEHLSVEELAEFVSTHRQAHVDRLKTYEQVQDQARDAGAAPSDLITLDFGMRYERAVLDWFDHLPTIASLKQ